MPIFNFNTIAKTFELSAWLAFQLSTRTYLGTLLPRWMLFQFEALQLWYALRR